MTTENDSSAIRVYLASLDQEIEIRPVQKLRDIPRTDSEVNQFDKVDAETLFENRVISGISQEKLDQIQRNDGRGHPAVWNELLSHLLPGKFTQAAQDPTLPDPVEVTDDD